MVSLTPAPRARPDRSRRKAWLVRPGFGAVLLALGVMIAQSGSAQAVRSALRRIVRDGCVPRSVDGTNPPQPCDAVDLAGGIALLKDRVGVAQMLAIATREVAGIEDPFVLADGAPNYFALAWREGVPLVERHLGRTLPRTDLALAINAATRRSQDQLHIHIDCLDPQVAATLAQDAGAIGAAWQQLASPLDGGTVWARWADGDDLAGNPFRLLADGLPEARAHLGEWSLAVVGAMRDGRPGFILLADKATGLVSGGHLESIQDHDCRIAGTR